MKQGKIKMRNSIMFAAAVLSVVACASAVKKEDNNGSSNPSSNAGVGSSNQAGDDTIPTTPPVTTPPSPPSVAPVDAGTKVPTNQAECITACEVQYPKATSESHALDTCFTGPACGSVCNDLGNSKTLYQPDADAGAACNTVAVDSYPIVSAKQDCSNCVATNAACCAVWISIFGSVDGRALNACSNACFAKFVN